MKLQAEITTTNKEEATRIETILNKEICFLNLDITLDENEININGKKRKVEFDTKHIYAIRSKKIHVCDYETFSKFLLKNDGSTELFYKRYLFN